MEKEDARMDKQKGRGRFVFLCLAPAVILFTVFHGDPHHQRVPHVAL